MAQLGGLGLMGLNLLGQMGTSRTPQSFGGAFGRAGLGTYQQLAEQQAYQAKLAQAQAMEEHRKAQLGQGERRIGLTEQSMADAQKRALAQTERQGERDQLTAQHRERMAELAEKRLKMAASGVGKDRSDATTRNLVGPGGEEVTATFYQKGSTEVPTGGYVIDGEVHKTLPPGWKDLKFTVNKRLESKEDRLAMQFVTTLAERSGGKDATKAYQLYSQAQAADEAARAKKGDMAERATADYKIAAHFLDLIDPQGTGKYDNERLEGISPVFPKIGRWLAHIFTTRSPFAEARQRESILNLMRVHSATSSRIAKLAQEKIEGAGGAQPINPVPSPADALPAPVTPGERSLQDMTDEELRAIIGG